MCSLSAMRAVLWPTPRLCPGSTDASSPSCINSQNDIQDVIVMKTASSPPPLQRGCESREKLAPVVRDYLVTKMKVAILIAAIAACAAVAAAQSHVCCTKTSSALSTFRVGSARLVIPPLLSSSFCARILTLRLLFANWRVCLCGASILGKIDLPVSAVLLACLLDFVSITYQIRVLHMCP